MNDIILEARDITKDFPGVRALDGVSFVLRRGEIHALCGENGAGKSTLINVLSGFHPAGSYSGEIFLDGQSQSFTTIREAQQAGIAVIHQELSLFPELTVTENIFVGHELQRGGILDRNRMFAEAVEWIARLKLEDVVPTTRVKDLGVGMFKAFLFGIIITIVACHEGFATTQGAVGVGYATRKAVIAAFLLILVVGYFVTRLFYV